MSRTRSPRLHRGVLHAAAALAVLLPSAAAVAAPGTSGQLPAAGVVAGPSAADCVTWTGKDFSRIHDAPTQLLAATVVPAQGGSPQYCQVLGVILGRIHFELDLPLDRWNRDYVQLGNGGFGGSIPTVQTPPTSYLAAGAAVASDDTGHVGTPFDATFGYPDNRQAQTDWAYLSEHVLLLAAQTLVPTFYGAPIAKRYFIGCSTGGRQALMEAQRYPGDFNGVVAGDPANYQNLLAPLEQGYRELANRDASHRLILNATDATTVQNAVLAACDKRDGVADGIINDPRTCRFPIQSVQCRSLGQTGCLSAAQVAVLARWYDDPRTTSGRTFFAADTGLPVGSEGGWPLYDIISDATFSMGGMFADQVLKFLAFPKSPGPTYSLYDFNFDRDAAKLRTMARLYNSDNPDMRAFRNRGGKLILYHGFADPLISPYGSIQYYEDAARVSGGLAATQTWFRFFLLPGMYHCSGGPGPDTVDWYGAIRGWVAGGKAPGRLVAAKVSNGTVSMTRPIYPYPQEARYLGHGNPNDARNFGSYVGPRGDAVAVDFGSYRHRRCETLC